MSGPAFRTGERGERSLALPLLIGLATVLASLLLQTIQIVRERSAIAAAFAEQSGAVLEGDRVRSQLESLLSGTNDLSRKGNGTATAILGELAKQGIVYKPPGAL